MLTKWMIVVAGLFGFTLGDTAISPAGATDIADPVHCEIQVETRGGMMQLTGVVHTDEALSGRYSFTVKSASRSGSTNISQGGAFSANANKPTTLGMVMLSANDTYDVELDVSASGHAFDCSDRLGNVL